MTYQNVYQSYRSNLSGSRTKNRYRYELYWGIMKVYELFSNQEEFCVVFDYASDIDVINRDSLVLYQLKTHNKKVTLPFLARLSASKESIVTKMAALDNNEYVKKLIIVSNEQLDCEDSLVSNQETICFSTLSPEEQEYINKHVDQVLHKSIDLSKYFYIRSDMCVSSPQKILLGETTIFLQKILKIKMVDPVYFLNYVQSKVIEKACYEMYPSTFEELVKNKALTRTDVKSILEDYGNTYNQYANDVSKKIDDLKTELPFEKIIKIKQALANISAVGLTDFISLSTIKSIIDEISSNSKSYEDLGFFDYVSKLLDNVQFASHLDYYSKICYILIAICKIENGEQ